MKSKVYIETTIISYLAAKGSRDLVVAGQQEITREWWAYAAKRHDLFTSQAVIVEVQRGDPAAVARRIALMEAIDVVPHRTLAVSLAEGLVTAKIVPPKAAFDALHIATATVEKADFLLTWNCRHIANASIQTSLRNYLAKHGYTMPVLCTPYELSY